MGHAANDQSVALLVDDDRDLRNLEAALIEETGLRVVEADSAEEALAYLQQHARSVSFLMTEIRLPCLMDGVELSRIASQNWPWIKVVVTSANLGHRPHDLPQSATYIPKPWRALDVLMEVERTVSREQHPQRSSIRRAVAAAL
jgi:DNA-binding NtrC family response regulator